MSQWSDDEARARECLSALLDGELDAGSTARTCAQWHEHADMRATWHAWHLIGDVLRSEDLASDPAHDAVFVRSLRARLAHEPVVLAPRTETPPQPSVAVRPASARVARRRSWVGSAAVAAGFVAVAGVLVVMRAPAPSDNGAGQPVLAQAPAGDAGFQRVTSQGPVSNPPAQADPQAIVIDGRLLRDARLDQYLAAHQQFSGSSALGAPSGFLRSATTEAPAR